MDAAFVTDGDVKNCKKRLPFSALSIVSFFTTFVPNGIQIRIGKIVVGFGIVSAVIALFQQEFSIGSDDFRFRVATAHLLISIGACIHSCKKGVACRGTNRSIGIGIGVKKAFCGKVVQVGCGGKGVAITAQKRTVIFACNPQYIWKLITLIAACKKQCKE